MSDDKKWQEVGGETITPKIVKQQRDALLRLKAILEGVVEQNQKKVAVVREQLHRMQHGGGS